VKVLSLNANKGLIKHMGDLLEADVVLSQEAYPHAEDNSDDASLLFPDHHSTATRYLLTLSKEPHRVMHLSEYMILTEHADGSVLGKSSQSQKLHFPSLLISKPNHNRCIC
jgi:hypothetical protein